MIFDAFDTLPAAISKTQRCHELFPDSLVLRDRALTVYIDLLAMIEGMISCLIDKKLCKGKGASTCHTFPDQTSSDQNKRWVERTSFRFQSG